MSPEVLVENSVSREGLRVLHVMGGAPVSKKWMEYIPYIRKMPTVREWEDEIHLHHLLVSWQAAEVVQWTFQVKPWLVRRNVVLWFVKMSQTMSEAILDAAVCYALNFGRDPLFAFVHKMPSGANEGVEVKGVMLIQADWVPLNFAILDSGGTQKLPDFRVVNRAITGEKQLKLSV